MTSNWFNWTSSVYRQRRAQGACSQLPRVASQGPCSPLFSEQLCEQQRWTWTFMPYPGTKVLKTLTKNVVIFNTFHRMKTSEPAGFLPPPRPPGSMLPQRPLQYTCATRLALRHPDCHWLSLIVFNAVFHLLFFSGAVGWRSAPKRPRLLGRKEETWRLGHDFS